LCTWRFGRPHVPTPAGWPSGTRVDIVPPRSAAPAGAPRSHAMHAAARRRTQAGFSFIEILVVMGIITLLASMVVVVIPIINERSARAKSQDNVKNLVMMMTSINTNISQWPSYSGKAFTLAPIAHGVLDAESPGAIEVFFSTSDSEYKVANVEKADYMSPNLTKQKLRAGDVPARLTSYAGRRNGEGRDFSLTSADVTEKGLICLCDDDDGPLHHKDGLIVAFANGKTAFIEWEELGTPKPKDSRTYEPFLGENASSELLKMVSSAGSK
jgi:prepilin-type N-terminal cleavage/methylation domain-containing protein